MNKKIAFLINSLTSGGAERVLSTILTELYKQNYNVELICLERNNFYKLPSNIKITYLSNSNGKENSIRKLLSLPILALKLKKYIINNNIDIVQSHVYRANFVNTLSRVFDSKHIIQLVNAGQVSMYKSKGIAGKINLYLIKKLYPLANVIICKSKGMEIDLQNYFKNRLNTLIINNPYDIDKINSIKNEEISDFKFNKEKIYLIYIGRFASFKKPEYVIESLIDLDKKVELILIGDGPNKKKLQDLAISLSLSNRIHFLGRVENPYKYIGKSDIFILSSNDGEGFPNVLVESMICRTAVISTDCKSGPREILAPNSEIHMQLTDTMEVTNYGILVPSAHSTIIAEAVNKIILNENIKNNFIHNAFIRTLDFSLNTIISQYKKVLELE